MEAFQPLINLLVLLSALSIAAERLANAVKLRDARLRTSRPSVAQEKEREQGIGHRVLLVSVALALLVKADLFQILAHLDAPWDTLGWIKGPSISEPARLAFSVTGSVLTGCSLGFGSKFWHDMLDIVYQTKGRLGQARKARHAR
jgi:hypothetical protein